MKECIGSNFDFILIGIVIGVFLKGFSDIVLKWAEIKALNDSLKLNKLLGESIIQMQEKLKAKAVVDE
jgi:hypothetical protein